MNVCVIGTGYVGLVTGVVFASLGNDVICVDKLDRKIENLKKGIMPIYEPGLEEFVERNVAEERLDFTTDLADAVGRSEVVFIAVGTPPQEDGSTDLSMVGEVAREIAEALTHDTLIVNKSTVPVGTGDYVRRIVEKHRRAGIPFDVVSNPEFLREGSAIKDTLEPDRIVIGANSKDSAMKLLELYAPLERPMIITDVESAELIKYASNAFLAVKITFANAMANICDAAGANIADVTKGMGLDSRIGPAFLNAGIGYGGSCFPKDTRSLIATADSLGYDFKLLKSTVETNADQPVRFVAKMRDVLGGLKGKNIGVLGLAFKGNTDDLRDSKAVEVIQTLLAEGAHVIAYDPVAVENARAILPDVTFAKGAYEVAAGADALAVVTEWNEFKQINFARIATILRGKVVFDGKNLYNPKQVRRHGLDYYGVGRGTRVNNGDYGDH
ncbi:MAG: UDP-glucose/GDP-mannose dehydrogenase family protein [Capsulimonadaceae bacterium]|nr:UDP-glucose/GDP-mannose dehydrogenase family protein [Capsulimonadaceae bacterium]